MRHTVHMDSNDLARMSFTLTASLHPDVADALVIGAVTAQAALTDHSPRECLERMLATSGFPTDEQWETTKDAALEAAEGFREAACEQGLQTVVYDERDLADDLLAATDLVLTDDDITQLLGGQAPPDEQEPPEEGTDEEDPDTGEPESEEARNDDAASSDDD
jgi:hypothetical protein